MYLSSPGLSPIVEQTNNNHDDDDDDIYSHDDFDDNNSNVMDDDDDSKEYDNRINEDKVKIQSKISDNNNNNTDNTMSIRTEDSYDKNKASNQTNSNINKNRI